MAKINAPFLSLSATGQFAKTMVASTWKGLKTMRQYVVPSNPNTAGQIAQRTALANAQILWTQNLLSFPQMATAWNLYASKLGSAMSGFNAFVRSSLGVYVDLNSTNALVSFAETAAGIPLFNCKCHTGDPAVEAGDFTIARGATPSRLTDLIETGVLADGTISATTAVPNGGAYYAITKGGFNRSGIIHLPV